MKWCKENFTVILQIYLAGQTSRGTTPTATVWKRLNQPAQPTYTSPCTHDVSTLANFISYHAYFRQNTPLSLRSEAQLTSQNYRVRYSADWERNIPHSNTKSKCTKSTLFWTNITKGLDVLCIAVLASWYLNLLWLLTTWIWYGFPYVFQRGFQLLELDIGSRITFNKGSNDLSLVWVPEWHSTGVPTTCLMCKTWLDELFKKTEG